MLRAERQQRIFLEPCEVVGRVADAAAAKVAAKPNTKISQHLRLASQKLLCAGYQPGMTVSSRRRLRLASQKLLYVLARQELRQYI